MDLNTLTPEQRQTLAREALEAERAQQQEKEADRQAYKDMVSEKVNAIFPLLITTSTSLTASKKNVYEEFALALGMKRELYDIKDTQNSHSFTNDRGDWRITLGCNTVDNYDDTANDGIAIVKEYISGLAKDENGRILVDAVMKLLSRDQKGTLKPSRVMQLRQMAYKSGDKRFMEGVQIIDVAYKPVPTKTYVRAEFKDENGAWKNLPLGMTEA